MFVLEQIFHKIFHQTGAELVCVYKSEEQGEYWKSFARSREGGDGGEEKRCFLPDAWVGGQGRRLLLPALSQDTTGVVNRQIAWRWGFGLPPCSATIWTARRSSSRWVSPRSSRLCWARPTFKSWPRSGALALRYQKWPTGLQATMAQLAHELSFALECASSLEEVIRRVGERLHEALNSPDLAAQGSIWLAEYARERLECKYEFGPGVRRHGCDSRLPGGCDRLGCAAPQGGQRPGETKRRTSPRRIASLGALWIVRGPDGRRPDRGPTVLPLIYRGRLVGVLNLESPIKKRISADSVAVAPSSPCRPPKPSTSDSSMSSSATYSGSTTWTCSPRRW